MRTSGPHGTQGRAPEGVTATPRARSGRSPGALLALLLLAVACTATDEGTADPHSGRDGAWHERAVVYHVFLDRFAGVENTRPSEEGLIGRLGGDLDGLADRLDHIAATGANTIWLSPVHPGPAAHGYHPTDLTGVEERLGGRAALDRVMAGARERGLRVVLDLVVSHTSDEHPWFVEARSDCTSPYVAWYRFRACPDDYAGFAGLRELPQLDLDHPDARSYVLGTVVPYWLDEVGVDGFRLDHVLGPSRDFWRELRRTVDEGWPGTLLLGEVWSDQRTIDSYRDSFDAATAFPHRDRMVAVFASGGDVRSLDHFLGLAEQRPGPIPATYLSSHDQPRFTHLAGDDTRRTALAHVALLTLPGIPVLYYGDEVGLSQRTDHTPFPSHADRFFREPMPWDPAEWDTELLATVSTVAAIRTASSALSSGELVRIVGQGDVLVFERRAADERMLVVVANGPHLGDELDLGALLGGLGTTVDADVRLRPVHPAAAAPTGWSRLLGRGDTTIRPDGASLVVPLAPPGYALLEVLDGELAPG